jgi:hypothetical protein
MSYIENKNAITPISWMLLLSDMVDVYCIECLPKIISHIFHSLVNTRFVFISPEQCFFSRFFEVGVGDKHPTVDLAFIDTKF